jgi:hypothetical protein
MAPRATPTRGTTPASIPRPRVPQARGGFVLALVVLMLFAISITAATGYLMVNTEFAMAKSSGEGAEALSVARAGLTRFVAEQLGVVGDSVSYAIGHGVAMITTRKLAEKDSLTDVYYIRSEGTVSDYFTPGTPARRVVAAYAYHHRRPLRHFGAFVVAADGGYSQNAGAIVDGNDHSTALDCPGGGASPIAGIVARTTAAAQSSGVLNGSPAGKLWPGGYAAMYDSIGLRWDVLKDAGFPVDFDGVLPDYGSIPADSFPVVRVHGYFNPGSSWSGRGLLIVDGELDAAGGFYWDGIVLAGSVDDIHEGHIRGMLVAGLDGPNSYTQVYWRGSIQYYSCYVYGADESLSYLELIDNTLFEAN